jgi:hypothetical protein
MDIFSLFQDMVPVTWSGVPMLAYYYTYVLPILTTFLIVTSIYRFLARMVLMYSGSFKPLPQPVPVVPESEDDGDIIEPGESNEGDDDKEKKEKSVPVPDTGSEESNEGDDDKEKKEKLVPVPDTDSEDVAMGWLMQYWEKSESNLARRAYRTYELWVPLGFRLVDKTTGAPGWFCVLRYMSKTPIMVVVASILIILTISLSLRVKQNPILGLVNCEHDTIDVAIHCEAYTESCHITPPCGPHPINYMELVATYHSRCTGPNYPKISLIQNICFMDREHETNSWHPTWLNLVGSDFHVLETTLIKFYGRDDVTPSILKRHMNMPVRVIYDQLGSLSGYGVNAITRTGIVHTNINHDDLMSVLTTWRQKKLGTNSKETPCICAPHLGILSRMIFMWEKEASSWKIFLDHNVTNTNSFYGTDKQTPTYQDFPSNVAIEIANSVRGEDDDTLTRGYPGVSTIDLLDVSMDISRDREIDLHTAQSISRYWAVGGQMLQEQQPHIYIDASLPLYRRGTWPDKHQINGHTIGTAKSSGFKYMLGDMSRSDAVTQSLRIIDNEAACYYQCTRIFDDPSVSPSNHNP